VVRLNKSLRSRTQRLSKAAHERRAALEEAWCFEALHHLSERDLHLLISALRREKHLAGNVLFPQLEHSPEEREAITTFFRAYERVKAEWGA
jgi:hypothetical protein